MVRRKVILIMKFMCIHKRKARDSVPTSLLLSPSHEIGEDYDWELGESKPQYRFIIYNEDIHFSGEIAVLAARKQENHPLASLK